MEKIKTKNDTSTTIRRICTLLTCILMLCAISITRHGSLFNYSIESQHDTDTATVSTTKDGTIVVNSTNVARDIHGYGGPVPLKVYVKDGVITQIEILNNAETPAFITRVKEEIVSQYIAKTPEQAMSLEVDAVSGATLSSSAVVATIGRSLNELQQHADVASTPSLSKHANIYAILAVLTALAAALLPLKVKNKRYRRVQQLCNIVFLGILSGSFVSYSAIVGVLANGFSSSHIALMIMLIISFIYPLFGKPGHYCAWCCPLGSAQELLGTLSKRKINIPRHWHERLTWFRQGLWCVLMLMSWMGIVLEWMDYELFTTFIWQSASWAVIAAAAVFAIVSLFINRPYCQFVCPTGTLLKSL
ncbi:MAG: FMN-binding protein [Muribaculaceae bacterium]